MRTKTCFVAAFLTAGLTTSLAQSNIYSKNVFGYVNLNLCSGFNLVANQLDYDGNGTNNTVENVFGTSLPSGTTVYAFSGGAFASPPATYSIKGGWSGNTNAVNAALKPGRGVFIQLPVATTVSFTGNVMQGTLSTPHVAGFEIMSSPVPQSGPIQDLGYSPVSGDVVYRFRCGAGYQSPFFSYSTKGGWQPSQPDLEVGEAVFLQSPTAGFWVRNFSVQ